MSKIDVSNRKILKLIRKRLCWDAEVFRYRCENIFALNFIIFVLENVNIGNNFTETVACMN